MFWSFLLRVLIIQVEEKKNNWKCQGLLEKKKKKEKE